VFVKEKQMDSWKKLFSHTALVAYFYIFMEWLFFATKPSFLNGMSLYENLTILFVSAGLVALIFAIPAAILFGIRLFLKNRGNSGLVFRLAVFFPALLLGALMLILLDNFTYSVFKFGIVSTVGIWRGVYGVLFLYLLWVAFHWIKRASLAPLKSRGLLYLPLALVAVSSLIAVERFVNRVDADIAETTSASGKLPHILLIGSDGVNAENMSVYGYERETTPFLDELAASALFAENAFADWNASAASITSMLTGKPPLEIQVFSGYDVLTGTHTRQHLPGILRAYGYYSVQMGVFPYVDAYAMNFQDAFDMVNGRTTDQSPIFQAARRLGQGDAAYFILRLLERISERLMHIYYYRVMTNPLTEVTVGSEAAALNDEEKIEQLINLLENADRPLFVHIHLMGTHGPLFLPSEQLFSAGQEQTQEWMPDYYDDSILTFDSYMRGIYDELAASGKLDNTVLIIYSDHGMEYEIQRLPLMFLFPNSEFAGRIKNNVQNLDVAPTILGYLEIPIPAWMEGHSLLSGEPSKDRLLVIGQTPEIRRVVHCERLYQLAVRAQVWLVGEMRGHTVPCQSTLHVGTDIPRGVLDYFSRINELDNGLATYPVFHFDNSSLAVRRDLAKLVLFYMNIKQEDIPPAQGIFVDVPKDDPDAPAIEYMYNQGLLDNCNASPLSFCPQDDATRQDAAIAMLRGAFGSDYAPPPAEGLFSDVPSDSPYAPWVEDLHRLGITSGCSKNPLNYCPESPILTDHLQTFLERVFFPEEN
jgi:arylsulfatase A-like enzyme